MLPGFAPAEGLPALAVNGMPENGSVIIRFLASKSLSLMWLGVPGLKRTAIGMVALVAASVAIVSCGGGGAPSTRTTHTLSGLPFRAFVSNPLFPSGTSTEPVIQIVDALNDVLSPSPISLFGSASQPGLMAVSLTKRYTMVFSLAGNSIAIINNATESLASTTPLPGFTQSIAFGLGETTGYAAVPSAPVTGQPPGAVVVFGIASGGVQATIPVPNAEFVVPSPDGNHLLVFSDGSDTVTVITTIFIGTSTDPRSYITGFDRPVWAIFTGDSSAYVFNCGPECTGSSAGVALLNALPEPGTTVSFGGNTIPTRGATYGLLSGSGNTLYVAGSPPGSACGSGTAATSCGILSLVDTGSMSVSSTALITDGYHDRMQLSQNGQLFIGSHSCTEISIPGGEIRGCLSIFNTTNSQVIVPTWTGDVTGIQAITERDIVYLCQGGVFHIYDTDTDNILVQEFPVVIVGDATDVKLVD
jgi:hypothetical protein